MNDRTIMQQALEALEDERYVSRYTHIVDVIDALKAALAQPEQEPSQWRDMVVVSLVREGINKHKARELADHFATPPAAQRKPLTDWQAQDIVEHESWGPDAIALNGQLLRTIRRTEAAHGIKEPKP